MQDQPGMTGRDWVLLVLLSILWGGSFFFAKVIVQEMPPFTLVFVRFACAAGALWVYLAVSGTRLPRSASIWVLPASCKRRDDQCFLGDVAHPGQRNPARNLFLGRKPVCLSIRRDGIDRARPGCHRWSCLGSVPPCHCAQNLPLTHGRPPGVGHQESGPVTLHKPGRLSLAYKP